MSEILSLWLCHAIEEFYDLLQVAYFNAWKGHMGRKYWNFVCLDGCK